MKAFKAGLEKLLDILTIVFVLVLVLIALGAEDAMGGKE